MGASTKELRQRITGVGNIQKITRAMEMVATTKLRRLQNRAEGARPYADTIRRLSARLGGSAPEGTSPLTEAHETVRRVAILAISSDRGLCGSYNTNLLRLVVQHIGTLGEVEPAVYTLGKKARSFFRKRMPVIEAYPDEVERLDHDRAQEIARELSGEFLDEKVDEVWVAYTRFVSMGRQEPTIEKLLPIEEAPAEEGEAAAASRDVDMILEPSPEELLRALLPKSLSVRLYAAILDSLASEFAARRMAMKAATDAAGDMITFLRRQYNRARQEGITTELLDIVGGAEALS